MKPDLLVIKIYILSYAKISVWLSFAAEQITPKSSGFKWPLLLYLIILWTRNLAKGWLDNTFPLHDISWGSSRRGKASTSEIAHSHNCKLVLVTGWKLRDGCQLLALGLFYRDFCTGIIEFSHSMHTGFQE